MGQTGFSKICACLQKAAVSCTFLRISAPPKCFHSQEKRKSAKLSEKLRIWVRLSLLVCPLYFPLTFGNAILILDHLHELQSQARVKHRWRVEVAREDNCSAPEALHVREARGC